MKKLVSILAVVVCLFMAIPTQAQILKFGVKGGLNVSQVTFSEDIFKGDNRSGFFIGPMAEFTIPVAGLGIDVAALYNQTEAKAEVMRSDAATATEKMKFIEVPVNLKWTVGLGSMLGVFVAAGPQFGFNVGHGDYANAFDMKTCYTSFNVGGGVKLFRHVQAGVNYNFGISKLAKAAFDEYKGSVDMKRKGWQLSLAYTF